jgi:hypothetical protein
MLTLSTVHAGYEGVWDMHAAGENLNMIDGMETVGRSFDHAVAAFIEDLEAWACFAQRRFPTA